MLFGLNTIIFALFVVVGGLGTTIYLVYLLIKALRKYINSSEIRSEKKDVKASLGETIKRYRIDRKMTQEFVAERIGVSRQAVSKWESGASDPSTTNLISLARLFDITPEELLRNVTNNESKNFGNY